MQNFERYRTRKGINVIENALSMLMLRFPSDMVISRVVSDIVGKSVCDVGCGTGEYSRRFVRNNNTVIGVDINPFLCREDITVIEADAAGFSKHVKESAFDVVFSAWLTEYLDDAKARSFAHESCKVMAGGGKFISTYISDRGFGYMYVNLAGRVRHIDKYCYSEQAVRNMLEKEGFKNIEIKKLNSWFGIPWAFLAIAEKPGAAPAS